MSENTIEDSTPSVNGNFPVFRPGEVILYKDFIARMKRGGFSDRTLARWKAAGFRVFYPGTSSGWVRTDDVIGMICREGEFPEYVPEYKQKE